MDRRSFLWGCSVSATVALIPREVSACISCHDFSATSGYDRSQLDCQAQTTCGPAGGLRPKAYLEQLHPGIFTRRIGRELEVSELLPYIPASIDGSLHKGDRIRKINGLSVHELPSEFTWAERGRSWCEVELDGRAAQTIRVELLTIGSLIDQAWLSKAAARTLAASLDEPVRTQIGGIEGNYATGVKLGWTGNHYLVSDVLIGSPADLSGLDIGDRIREASEIGSPSNFKTGVEALLPKPYPSAIRLKLEQGDNLREVNIKSVGLSLLLHSIAKTPVSSRSVAAFAL